MSAPYEPLHVHSTYSLLHGTQSVQRLAEQAAHYGHTALALTDDDNLYGAVPFARACKDWGIKPIIGTRIVSAEGNAVLLAENAQGYGHLCRIVSQRKLDPGFSLARCLLSWNEGVHVLTSKPELIFSLAEGMPLDRLWGELAAPGGTSRRFEPVMEACRRTGARPVATPAISTKSRAEHALHRTLTAIRKNTLVTKLSSSDLAHPDAGFKPPASMASFFRHVPHALRNTLEIAERCHFQPDRPRDAEGRYRWILPSLCLPGGEAPRSYLERLCREGMRKRYGRERRRAHRRLEEELALIHRMGFTDYFIIVGDLVAYAHQRGIATVGRGSGAGSLTAYLLGITNVDPIRYGLYFERFLHAKRDDCPDLDIDFCWKRRDEVIDYVYDTYGHDRVAMISTHNTFRFRSAFREAAKAFGVDNTTVNALSKRLPYHASNLGAVFSRGPAARLAAWSEPPWPRVLEHAQRILSMPRNLGIHPGGVVIADRPIDTYVPLEEAAKGIVVTQYEMRAIEHVGLVKMDLLGNRAISTIQETVDLVAERTGERVDPQRISHADPKTAALMAAGDTLGVFQMESPGMRNLNRMLETRDLLTTIAAVALIRPGPAGSGMKERFVRRSRGLEPPHPMHPRLEHVLRETHGIPLYEEDVMRIVAESAGLSLEDADMVRRTMAKAGPEELGELERLFQVAACKRGFSSQAAGRIWNHLLQFGSFAFCKAHAAGYGVLSYQSAWLKAHYPLEFTCALLNHHAGMYDKRTHLQDAQRRGVKVLLPCVNRSSAQATAQGAAVRLGLDMVRGLHHATQQVLLEDRERHGAFVSLADCLSRVPMVRSEAEALVLAGAFDRTGRTRPELLCMVDVYRALVTPRGRPSPKLFRLPPQEPRIPARPEFSRDERLWMEWHLTGICVDRHPLDCFRPDEFEGVVPIEALGGRAGKAVRVCGVTAARRTVPTKQNQSMQFLTLDDPTGMLECTLFPDAHRRYRSVVRGLGPFLVEGRLENQYGATTLTVEKLRPVPLPEHLRRAGHRVSAVLGPRTT